MANIDELKLAKDLIKFPSITPKDAGAIVNRTASRADPNPGVNKDGASNDTLYIPSQHSALVCRQFSLLVNEPLRFGLDIVMFAVYKSQNNTDLLSTHQELAWGIIEGDLAREMAAEILLSNPLNSLRSPQPLT